MAMKAARIGGHELLKWMGKTKTSEKNPGDFVTQADFASQKAIHDFLSDHFPNHGFVGEEDDGTDQQFENGQLCWIVDPLDGTKNYIHGLRSFSVSIALVQINNESVDQILAGAVLDPAIDECYSAGLGTGAELNGQPIQVSGETELREAMLVCSFSTRVSRDSAEVHRFLNLLGQAGSIRRLGSAALNLCYLACGRLDGYWASSLQCWDVAAGALILTEAGGDIVDLNGAPFKLRLPSMLATSSPGLREKILPALQV